MSRVVLIAGFAVLFTGSVVLRTAHAQSDSQQSPSTQPAPAPAKDKSPAKPPTSKTDTGKAGTTQPPASGDASAPVPAKKSTAEDNPFPEELSKKAQDAAEGASTPPREAERAPDTSPPDSKSGSSSSASGLHLEDLGSGESVAHGPDPKRARKDLDVGGFYMQTGNYKGAYERYKDAVVCAPEDAEAAYHLAEAARKLNLTAEAIQNYQHSLELDPDGPKAKAAKKALASLGKDVKP